MMPGGALISTGIGSALGASKGSMGADAQRMAMQARTKQVQRAALTARFAELADRGVSEIGAPPPRPKRSIFTEAKPGTYENFYKGNVTPDDREKTSAKASVFLLVSVIIAGIILFW